MPRSAISRVRSTLNRAWRALASAASLIVDGDDFGTHHQFAARVTVEFGAMLVQEPLGAQRARAGDLAQGATDAARDLGQYSAR